MVEFCPECGNMLRKKSCACGYNKRETNSSAEFLLHVWAPPSPNIIYCKITSTKYEKLKKMLSKGIQIEKLKEIREKIEKHLYNCCNCVYYNEGISHCQLKNKYLRMDSICKSFEPFEENN
ncbi:MAG: hypothetical protein ACFFA0_04780 [Promethearchaeota archaeon]